MSCLAAASFLRAFFRERCMLVAATPKSRAILWSVLPLVRSSRICRSRSVRLIAVSISPFLNVKRLSTRLG